MKLKMRFVLQFNKDDITVHYLQFTALLSCIKISLYISPEINLKFMTKKNWNLCPDEHVCNGTIIMVSYSTL